MSGPRGYMPYERVTVDGKACLKDPKTGECTVLTEVVTDVGDGIDPDEDFDFDMGRDWAADAEPDTSDE